MKKYNQFVSESIKDKMTPKSLEEIKKTKEGKDGFNMIMFIKDMLNKKIINNPEELYSLEEIKNYLDNRSILGYNGSIRFLKLDLPLLFPNKKQLIDTISGLKNEHKNRQDKSLLELHYYLDKEFRINLIDYLDIDELEKDIQKKKGSN